jgi:peroxiredoxin
MAVLALVGLLGFGLLTKSSDSLELGEPAPDGALPRLEGGGEVSLTDYRGTWVLVNFWASWCDPCRDESPALESFHRRYRDRGFSVLGIDTQDLSGDGQAFVREFGLTYPHLRDADGAAAEDYGTTGVPESFLVDPEGKVRLVRRGPVDEAYLEEFVAPLVSQEAS